MNRIAFRVDASIQMGTGHFMRCLTLADAARQFNAQIRFVSRHLPEQFQKLLAKRGYEFKLLDSHASEYATSNLHHAAWLGTSQLADAQDSVEAISDHLWDWVVVDHYALDRQWERTVRHTAKRILVIDDLADRDHDCDALLDQNYYSDMDTRYADKVPSHCQLMAGPRYAMLRDEFGLLHAQAEVRRGSVRRVLVCFGGTDIGNYTKLAMNALASIGNLQTDVVIGALHPDREEIEMACLEHGFKCHVQTSRMAELIAGSDLAIGSGGTTVWERCCLGLPAIVTCTADNQRRQIEDAASDGLVYALDARGDIARAIHLHLCALIENENLRRSISRRALTAVDGRGVSRVLGDMGYGSVTIRLACEDDSRNLYEWRNHPSIRAASRNADTIPWASHQEWLAATLAAPGKVLLIGQQGERTVGVVRFDIQDDTAEISIYLTPDSGQPGMGRELLQAAELWFTLNYRGVDRLRAHVLGANHRSNGLFLGLDYQIEATQYSKRLHRNG